MQGRLKDALVVCDGVVAADPEYAQGYADRGTVRGMAGRIQGAVDDLRKAIALGDAQPATYCTMAAMLSRMGMPHRALEVFAQAQALDAKYPFTYFNRAAAHEKLGDKQAARQDLQTCLGFDGNAEFKAAVRKRLAALA